MIDPRTDSLRAYVALTRVDQGDAMNERIRSSAVGAITATMLLLTACAAESETRILEAPGAATSDANTDVVEEDPAPELQDPADGNGAGATPETLEDYLGTVAFAVRGGGAGARGGAPCPPPCPAPGPATSSCSAGW